MAHVEVGLTTVYFVSIWFQAHYDLAISVALWQLDKDEERDVLDGDIM